MKTSGTMNSATGHTSVSTRTGNFSDGLYDKAGARPDLDLDFARTKSLKDRVSKEELITFTRGTSRIRSTTYVDENGLVKTAGHNLILYSHDIGNPNHWITIEGSAHGSFCTVTRNTTETTAPNGMFEATKLVMDSGTTSQRVTGVHTDNYTGTQLQANDFIIYSVYLKSATNSNYPINLSVSGTSRGLFTVTPEWQRFAIRAQRSNVVDFRPRVILRNTASNGSNPPQSDGSFVNQHAEIYAWGAQMEFDGTTGTGQDNYTGPIGELVKTTTQPSGAPRFTYDPETLESRGLLIEKTATNVSANSEDFTHLTPNHATLTQNAGTAPDGTNTAVKFSPNANTNVNRHIVEKRFGSLTNEPAKTGSVWVKADPDGNGRYVQFGWAAPGGQNYLLSTFDTETGQVTDQQNTGTTGGGGFLEATPYPNGWYRLRVTSTDTGGNVGFLKLGLAKYPTHAATQAAHPGNAALHGSQKFVGDAAEHSILIWGHQAEANSFCTSYIPTSGSTVTRSPDLASIEGDNFGTYRTNKFVQTKHWQAPFSAVVSTGTTITRHADANPVTGEYDAIKATITNVGSDAAVQQNISGCKIKR